MVDPLTQSKTGREAHAPLDKVRKCGLQLKRQRKRHFAVKPQVISRRSASQDAEALFPAQVSSVSCSWRGFALIGTDT
jgi:hypothetical protein